jgi:hypothetical protein
MRSTGINGHQLAERRQCRRPRRYGVLLCVTAIACWCGLLSASAFGAVGHRYQSDITSAGTEPLREPASVAVDRANGDVFVADQASGYVNVYDSTGKYLAHFGAGELDPVGIAVAEATGVVYVADAAEDGVLLFKPGAAGEYTLIGEWLGEGLAGKEFGEVTGVAVDNSTSASAGDVYVVDGEDAELSEGVVDVFKPKPAGSEEAAEGELVRVLSKGKMEEPNGVAIDSTGKVYVADSAKGAVFEFSATGTAEGKLTGKGPEGTFAGPEEETGNVTAVAIDPLSGDLLVAESERDVVAEFNPAGEWVGWITSSPTVQLGEPRGVAVSGAGSVYLADSLQARVSVFAPGLLVPDAASSKAARLTRTTAELAGTVNGDGKAGHDFFEYGTSRSLGSSTTPAPFGDGEEKILLTATELHAGTAYYYRLAAENENGTNYGAIREFETPTAVEGLSTGPAINMQPTSATLTGTLTPNGVDAHYYFEWGKTSGYGNDSPVPPGEDAGAGTSPVSVEAGLAGLTANTTYHYRLLATNSFGITTGLDEIFTTSGPPRITNKPVTGLGHATATLNAEVNPDELETAYHIEYGETTSYGTETPSGGASLGSGGKPVAVTASLTGLKLGVKYHYRLVASNSAGTTTGPDQTFTTIPPALITSYATEVTPTTAVLGASIDPLGNDTTYYFQYGTQPCASEPSACSDRPAPPGEDIGAGETPIAKTLDLTELEPDTTYYYRVLALNSLGEATGPERALTTPKPTQTVTLPDNRAWELVTPTDKEGAPVEALTREGGVVLASETGNGLTYVVDGAQGAAEGNRSPEMQQILATRGASQWANQDIATPNAKATGLTAGQAPEYQYFNPSLATALVEPAGAEPFLAPGVSYPTPYLRDNAAGTYTGLVTEADVAPGALPGSMVHFLDASPDLSHVIVSSNVALEGPDSGPGLYEWSGGALSYVSGLPNGNAAPTAELGFHDRMLTDSVSEDGTRVVWTNKEENAGNGHLYLRDTTTSETLQLDAAQGVSEPIRGSAQFQAASADDSRIFFTDKQRLTPDSTAEPKYPEKADLYECEIAEEGGKQVCRLKDLTDAANEGEHAAVQGFVFGAGQAADDVYLVGQGVLATNENGTGEAATPGAENLYWMHYDGSHWTTRFIAQLSSEDNVEWEGNRLGDAAFLTARVSPNGRYLAFMTAASPTGYDNVEANPEAKAARAEEVYIYDSADGGLTCVSCDPSGARPSGVLDHNESGEGLGLLVDRRKVWAEAGHEHWLGGNIPGWTAQTLTSALFQSRYLTDQGRLFFNSPDELVPAAKDHKENVYEYEPSGVGSCESITGGCVALLSSGTSEHESAFIEASSTGNDVFFVTASNLLPQDTDTAFDIYDARVCTSASPCQTVPAPPAEACETTETCRPAPPPSTYGGGPSGTSTDNGSGNAIPPAPKGTVLGITRSKPAAKPLTRHQKLVKALATCQRHYPHSRTKRKACETRAQSRYGQIARKTRAAAIQNNHVTATHRGPR